MPSSPPNPKGRLTFTLHAHLPYVVNHGTWPHGMEWLHEAAAETYLPLLRVFHRLERDSLALRCNLNLSPVLLEQLTHPVFLAEFPRYLTRKSIAAREDEAFFLQSGESEYAETARFWQRFYTEAADDFQQLGGNLVAAFKGFADRGLIEIITCAATHGYMPLLGTDESVRAQIQVAVETHLRHFGRAPRGIWLPECGYRPAGLWSFPTSAPDGSPLPGPTERIGIEQALSEAGLGFFFVDTHLVEASRRAQSPYGQPSSPPPAPTPDQPERSLYFPYFVDGPSAHDGFHAPVTIFPRDPRTGLQVWSGDTGYPGDGNYVDFHKKRWPGGHRYWRVTGPQVSQEDKQPYRPHEAAARVQSHAQHFVSLVREALEEARAAAPDGVATPILCSPFDAELFGHWWFEGPLWLEAVVRVLHEESSANVELISCPDYLVQYPRAGSISMPEGSWGAEGNNQVWLNPETAWTYTHIYPAELYVREVATAGRWRSSPQATEIVQQLCRELLLLESSDWQFLITTGAARDYAEMRFLTHNEQFLELKRMWQSFESEGTLNQQAAARLAALRERDGLFPDLDPTHWATAQVT